MRVFLSKVSSVRDQATLVYVARFDENVGVLEAMEDNQLYLINHGSIDTEYEFQLSHTDMRYRNHNGNLFGYLEEATCSTS